MSVEMSKNHFQPCMYHWEAWNIPKRACKDKTIFGKKNIPVRLILTVYRKSIIHRIFVPLKK